MTETFGDAALRLCGAAATLLGWRPAEFWNATPAELAAVLRPVVPGADAPDAAAVNALRAQFPDD